MDVVVHVEYSDNRPKGLELEGVRVESGREGKPKNTRGRKGGAEKKLENDPAPSLLNRVPQRRDARGRYAALAPGDRKLEIDQGTKKSAAKNGAEKGIEKKIEEFEKELKNDPTPVLPLLGPSASTRLGPSASTGKGNPSGPYAKLIFLGDEMVRKNAQRKERLENAEEAVQAAYEKDLTVFIDPECFAGPLLEEPKLKNTEKATQKNGDEKNLDSRVDDKDYVAPPKVSEPKNTGEAIQKNGDEKDLDARVDDKDYVAPPKESLLDWLQGKYGKDNVEEGRDWLVERPFSTGSKKITEKFNVFLEGGSKENPYMTPFLGIGGGDYRTHTKYKGHGINGFPEREHMNGFWSPFIRYMTVRCDNSRLFVQVDKKSKFPQIAVETETKEDYDHKPIRSCGQMQVYGFNFATEKQKRDTARMVVEIYMKNFPKSEVMPIRGSAQYLNYVSAAAKEAGIKTGISIKTSLPSQNPWGVGHSRTNSFVPT